MKKIHLFPLLLVGCLGIIAGIMLTHSHKKQAFVLNNPTVSWKNGQPYATQGGVTKPLVAHVDKKGRTYYIPASN